MKKHLTVFILLIIFCSYSKAQWVAQNISTDVTYLHSINFINSSTGVTTGLDFSSPNSTSGRVYTTTNAGVYWISSNVPMNCRVIISSEYIASSIVYGAGAMNSFADKKSFSQNLNNYNNSGQRKYPESKLTSSAVYRGAFFKSSDGGLKWFEVNTLPVDTQYLTYMDFLDANTGMVVADVASPQSSRNNIYKTTDGGLTWSIMLMENIVGQLESIQYINSNLIVATGTDFIDSTQKSIFLKTTNGGANWTKQVRDSAGYKKVFFINSNTGFIAASSYINIMTENFVKGFIYKTTDQGNTWNTILYKDSLFLNGINFYGESGVGIAFGNRTIDADISTPVVFRTSNFGVTWSIQTIQTDPTLPLKSCMLDKYNYYISGGFDNATIHHTINGGSVGVNEISSITPEKISLEQNYPNPFNPATTIRFNIPVSYNVILKVYNIDGKEIATLVNDVKTAGSYEVKFDASAYPSGIYYYRLISDRYSETRKMILIK